MKDMVEVLFCKGCIKIFSLTISFNMRVNTPFQACSY